MSSHPKPDKSDQAADKSEPDEVVKVQPDDHAGPVGIPLQDAPAEAVDQPPAGPGADLFATWNDPAPLDEADEVAGDDA